MLLLKIAIAMKKSPENEKLKFISILRGCEEIKFFRKDFGCKISSQIWGRAKRDNFFFKDNNDFGPRKQILQEFLELGLINEEFITSHYKKDYRWKHVQCHLLKDGKRCRSVTNSIKAFIAHIRYQHLSHNQVQNKRPIKKT